MYNALTLSHYFVKKSMETRIPITAYKAEFLVYFAHGWHLAIDGRSLISEEIKAWRHGPVVESVHRFYNKVKPNKMHATLDPHLLEHIKDIDIDFLDGIWMYYGHLNEVEMLNLCLERGTPWDETYEKSSTELIISNKVIEHHYRLIHVSHPEFCDLDDPISIAS